MKLSTESCLQVNRFRYELQPATTCNKDSGLRQNDNNNNNNNNNNDLLVILPRGGSSPTNYKRLQD